MYVFIFFLRGMEDDICPYATFHLLGFREEMDPAKAMQFQTFPHQNGHCGTLGPGGVSTNVHHRSGSQSMVTTYRNSIHTRNKLLCIIFNVTTVLCFFLATEWEVLKSRCKFYIFPWIWWPSKLHWGWSVWFTIYTLWCSIWPL
jgi:hypothetical protein